MIIINEGIYKMFDGKTEEQAKEIILEMVSEYYRYFHDKEGDYQSGKRITYAKRIYNEDEMKNLVDSALDFWLTSGKYTEQFERRFSEFLNVKYCNLVNSGSSANLLAFMALTSPLLGERMINRGDEVITVACGFPTTVTPILQYGAVPVFVDVTIPQYNIDVRRLEEAYSSKTKAVMIAHTMGNPFDLEKVKSFCDKYNLWLIEDNCDALGSQYKLNGKKYYTGTIGDIGTSSFYPPHHMTMGEGGAVYTNNALLNKIIRSLRDWGRDCICGSGQDNLCRHRFHKKYGQLPIGYDHKYVYGHFGYNLKVTDMQAAIGCAQLDKVQWFIEKRQYNFEYLRKGLEHLTNKVILPTPAANSQPSWFGFLITCKSDVDRNKVTQYLEEKGIQTRTLFAGNLIKHPCFDHIRKVEGAYRIVGELKNTDYIMEKSFWVGVYPGMNIQMMDYMLKSINEALL